MKRTVDGAKAEARRKLRKKVEQSAQQQTDGKLNLFLDFKIRMECLKIKIQTLLLYFPISQNVKKEL